MAQPSVAPISDGGIQIEWHKNGKDLEIEFTPDREVMVYAAGFGPKEEWHEFQMGVGAGTESLAELLNRLIAEIEQ